MNSEAVVKPLVSGILFQTCVDFLLRAVAVLLGYFNLSFANKNMKDLCDMFELNHLIKNPTCFKGSNPLCTDNIYTNKKTRLFNSSTVKIGISNHHNLISTMLRSTFCKDPAKLIYYRFSNNYNKKEFENVLKQITWFK